MKFKRRLKYCLLLVFSAGTIVGFGLEKEPDYSDEYNKALLFFNNQQYDSAGYYFKSFLQSMDSPEETASNDLKGSLCLYIGNCELLNRNFSSALSWFSSVLTEVRKGSPMAVAAYQNIGNVCFLLRDFESAVQNYQKALLVQISGKINDPVRLFEILANLGSAYTGNQENQKGLTCLLNAESLFPFLKTADSLAISGVYLNLGKLFLSSGDPGKALNYYCKSRKRYDEKRVDHPEIGIGIDKGMALSYLAFGCFDSAAFYVDKAGKVILNGAAYLKDEQAGVYLLKGDIFLKKGDFDSAFCFYDRALHLISMDLPVQDSSENKIVSSRPDHWMLTDVLERNARIQLILGINEGDDTNRLKTAMHYYNELIRINNKIQRRFLKDKSRLVFNDAEKNIFTGALETSNCLWRSGLLSYKDTMWTISELMRGRVLESKLRESEVAVENALSDALELQRMEVRSKIGELSRKRITGFTPDDEHSLFAIHKELENFIDLLIEEDSLTMKWKNMVCGDFEQENTSGAKSIAEIRSCLHQKDCILEYYFADTALYIFLVSSDTFHVERIIPCKSFSSRTNDLIKTIQHFDSRDFPENCQRLYSTLIEPVRPLLEGKQHLIIIPDEEISIIPFEVLGCCGNRKKKGVRSSPLIYLNDEFSISYQISSSSFLASRLKRWKDPIRFLGIAPGFIDNQASGIRYDPLKSSLAEVQSIETLFRKGNLDVHSLMNKASLKKSILQSSGNYSHLHFATHSLMNGLHPEFSGLVVEADKLERPADSYQESVLWCDEIENSGFNADLVVLSACGTGRGRLTRTEGILGLPRSFLIAGSSNVLYTLWNIPDHHARNFMEIFYKKFLSGKTYADALRETKSEMLRSEVTSHPYLWAGFVLLGN